MPTHAEKRLLPHTPEQMFRLVADVARYPEFLPWCIGARIRKQVDNVIWADLIVGFKIFREQFTSQVTLNHDVMRIDVVYLDGPFKHLNNHWSFEAHADGVMIDFYVDFEFRSRILQKAIGAVFNEAVQMMVSAFERQAKTLYAHRPQD